VSLQRQTADQSSSWSGPVGASERIQSGGETHPVPGEEDGGEHHRCNGDNGMRQRLRNGKERRKGKGGPL
jgi:hypothetical protein